MAEIFGAVVYLKNALGITPRVGHRDWKDIWLDSPEYQQAISEIVTINEAGLARPHNSKKTSRTCGCKR